MSFPTKAQQKVLNKEIIYSQAHVNSDVKIRGTCTEKQALKVVTESNVGL